MRASLERIAPESLYLSRGGSGSPGAPQPQTLGLVCMPPSVTQRWDISPGDTVSHNLSPTWAGEHSVGSCVTCSW